MCVINVSFSQPGCFHRSKVEWNTSDHDNRMGSKKPFPALKVNATCNILNHTPIYSTALLASIVAYRQLCWQNRLTSSSPPKAANMPSPGGLSGTQLCRKCNPESLEDSIWTATCKESLDRKQTNQYHPRPGYGYLPSQLPIPATPLFYQHSPSNKTHCSQPTTSASLGFPNFGPQW